MLNIRKAGLAVAALALTGLMSTPARAQVTFSASGNVEVSPGNFDSVSSQATFNIVNNQLVLVLTNTTPGGTLHRGSLLTDFFFTISGATTNLSYDSANGPFVYQNGALVGTNVNLKSEFGSGHPPTLINKDKWQFKKFTAGETVQTDNGTLALQYGIATVGDSGLFNGNLTGGEDYGIGATGTDTTQSGLNSIPIVINSASFNFGNIAGLTSLTQITGVGFSYGSAPNGVLTQQDVPEPGALAALAGLLVGGGTLFIRKRRAAK